MHHMPLGAARSSPKHRLAASALAAALALSNALPGVARGADELFPKHLNAATQQSIKRGLEALASRQSPDGNFSGSEDGREYAVTMTALAGMAFLANGNTPTRGPYAENIRRAATYVMSQANGATGLISSGPEYQGRSMYGHGFGLLFLSSVYGMETDDRRRTKLKEIIEKGIQLTARSQSRGGWTYVPGGGDEGSVTVTQMQALRAAQNGGFTVPKGTIEASIKYLEMCQTPEGGICYSLSSRGTPQLAISAAALTTLYNAGDYDSKMADKCLQYVRKAFGGKGGFNRGGHAFYTHLYASQAFYQAGDEIWDDYFPAARDQLMQMQQKDGTWTGDGVGHIYGTSVALIVLQLPYKYLPIYQR